MTDPSRSPTSPADGRRALLGKAARWLALGVIGGGVLALVARKASQASEECSNDGLCRGCPSYTGCGLPTALSMKQALGERDGGNGGVR